MVKSRLCIVTHTFLPHVGGIEKVVNEQSKRLLYENYAPMVVTNRIQTPKHYQVDGVPVDCYESLNTGFRLGIPYSIPTIPSLPTFTCAVKHAQIVHAHGHPYLTSLLAGRLAKFYGKPFVLTQHNTFIDYNNFFNQVELVNDLAVGKQNLGAADKIITISNATKDYVLRLGANPNKIRVIYNGVDLVRFRPQPEQKTALRQKLGFPKDAVIVLTVRRLVYKNGIDTLLDCASIAIRANPKIVFVVAGKGPDLENVRQQAKQRGIASNFRLAGFVSDGDLAGYYNATDLFVLPSKSGEGLPLVALEAMACGLPVIATNVGGIGEVPVAEFGKLVPPNQPEQLAEAVLEFAQTDFGSQRFELRARVEERFSWETNVKQLLEIYEELI
ncbi:MAG: glycosyltransferase family 4 protein [Nitrososphaerota archaeon]|jgi:glycosyltransferase involved in cell wall biosynthesis|nr:glycosyltransferase family 4 protein [Nitrososphaerota archaeon]